MRRPKKGMNSLMVSVSMSESSVRAETSRKALNTLKISQKSQKSHLRLNPGDAENPADGRVRNGSTPLAEQRIPPKRANAKFGRDLRLKLFHPKNALASNRETSMHKSKKGNLSKMPQFPTPRIAWNFPTPQILHQNLLHQVQGLSQV